MAPPRVLPAVATPMAGQNIAGLSLTRPKHRGLAAQRQQRGRDQADDEDRRQAELRQRQRGEQGFEPGLHRRIIGAMIGAAAAILLPPF
jgi:hypothetical protein